VIVKCTDVFRLVTPKTIQRRVDSSLQDVIYSSYQRHLCRIIAPRVETLELKFWVLIGMHVISLFTPAWS